MSRISDMLMEYSMLREKSKTIKNRMTELSKEIKEHLTSNVAPDSKGSYYSEDENYIYGNMAKKSIKLNEEKAKAFLQERNLLEQVTEVKVVIKEDKLEQLLSTGEISLEEFETLVDTKVTYSIDIKEKKKEEEEEVFEVKCDCSLKPKRRRLVSRR